MFMGRKQGTVTNRQEKASLGIGESIRIDTLSRDEIQIALSFLNQYEVDTGTDNKPHISRTTVDGLPLIRVGQATFSRLRYKLENAIHPKDIDQKLSSKRPNPSGAQSKGKT